MGGIRLGCKAQEKKITQRRRIMEDEDNLLNEWGAPHVKPKFTTFSTTRDVSLEHDNVGKTRQILHVCCI
jgi:hypothetical protein